MSYILYQSAAAYRATPRLTLIASKVTFTVQPSGAVNGVALTTQPVVQLRDVNNQPVPTAGVVVFMVVSSGSATLSGTTSVVTDANGTATFTNLVLTGVIGANSLNAAANGLLGAISTSVSLTVGVASRVSLQTQPAGAIDAATLTTQPVARLQDLSGNNVAQAGTNVTITIASGSGSLAGTTTVATDGSGIATFTNVAVDAASPPATFTLSFGASGLTAAVSAGFTVLPVPGTTPYYTTAFPGTENPISESGKWTDNGAAVALDLSNVQTTPGKCFGTQSGTNNLDDSTAALAGTWAPDQIVQATVFNGGAGGSKECELHLRFTTSAHAITGYECLIPVGGGLGEIVKWTGISGGQITFASLVSGSITVANGDVFSASIIGTTIRIFRNGSQVLTVTDASYSSGRPGVGFFRRNDGPQNSDFGFTNYTATAATRLAMVTQPAGAVDAIAFTTQPSVRVVDSLGGNVPHPGIVITAVVQTGTGSVVGTATATTDSNGVATWTTLGINATTPPANFTLRFSASFAGQSLATVDSATVNVTATSWIPNRPAVVGTLVTDYNFDATSYPTSPSDIPNFDGSGWGLLPGNLALVIDATATSSPPNVMQVTQPASGGGGTGAGNLYRLFTPNTIQRIYICTNVRHSVPYNWNGDPGTGGSDSNKFLVLFGPNTPGNINFESRFNGQYCKVVDGPTDTIHPTGATGVNLNDGAWHMVEWYVDAILDTMQCWVDGTLKWTENFAMSGGWDELLLSSTWGGGGTHQFSCQRFHDRITVYTATS